MDEVVHAERDRKGNHDQTSQLVFIHPSDRKSQGKTIENRKQEVALAEEVRLEFVLPFAELFGVGKYQRVQHSSN